MSRVDETAPIRNDPDPVAGTRSGITTSAAVGIVLIGLIVAGWQSYFTVVVIPEHIDRTCIAGNGESIPIIVANRTNRPVRVVGVTSDCGCFQASETFPVSIPARSRLEIVVRYSCPDGSRSNTIGVMVADDSTRVYQVNIRHTVRSDEKAG